MYSIAKQITYVRKKKFSTFKGLFSNIQELTDISRIEIMQKKRLPCLVRVRQLFCIIAHEKNIGNFVEIAEQLNVSHSTVSINIKKIKKVFKSERMNNYIKIKGMTVREIYQKLTN